MRPVRSGALFFCASQEVPNGAERPHKEIKVTARRKHINMKRKTWSKLTALLLALVMTVGLAGTAFADEKDAKGYTDVPDWAQQYVDVMTEKKLIDGKSETEFGADDPMTRADLAVALYRLAGSPANAKDAANPFKDVADDAAYKDAVVWAYSQKIISGDTPDMFKPEDSIERQAIAKMVNEFAARQVKKDKLTSREDVMSAYPDADKVGGWAKDYMNWAVACELITGSDGMLLPEGTATRAQVSAILWRYLDDASTGDASKDDPRNQDGIGKKELLVVSFGTSFNDSRVATIKAVEDAMEKAFPDYSVRRGFTANIIIEHVYRRDGEVIDDVKEALERAKDNKVEELLVQPTHLMNGWEYGDLVEELKDYADDFKTIKVGAPLLTTDDDFSTVADAMVKATESLTEDGKTAVCYMGHGTAAASNGIYSKMQKVLTDKGYNNYFIGTVESEPTAEDLAKLVKEAGYTTVVLRPMMIVAGDHANNDMAGDEADSWKSVFTAAGLEVQCEVKGLGELKAVRDLLVAHAKEAKALDETGIEVEPNPENAKPKALADGTYAIDVKSDSAMFKVVACELTVKDGKMTAKLTLSGTGYDQMYVGTAAQAKLAKDGFVNYEEDADGKYTFTVSVGNLDEDLAYAAHAVKSDKWYDRTLTFDGASAAAK